MATGAIIAGLVGSTAATAYSAYQSGKATDAAKSASKAALSQEERMFQTALEQQAPWQKAGEWALGEAPGYYIQGPEKYYGGELDYYISPDEDLDARYRQIAEDILFQQNVSGTMLQDLYKKFGVKDSTELTPEQRKMASKELAPYTDRLIQELKKRTRESEGTGLIGMIEAGPGDFKKSPGYEFRLREGQKAVQRSAAARGGVLSGSAFKAIERYGQNYASGEWDKFLARYYQSLSPWQSVAGLGQTNASQMAGLTGGMGENMANTIMSGGTAQASGYANQANIVGGGLQGASNLALLYGMGAFKG